MSTISASTTSTTAYVVTADTTGTLVIKTGSTPTTAVTIGSDQSVTFAGTPTYSGGTANGVAYLNGSKVFTTGSALVFDGTNLGLGIASPYSLVRQDVQIASATTNWALNIRSYDAGSGDGTTTAKVLRTVNSGNGNWANAQYDAWAHAWTKSGSTVMTLASTGYITWQTTDSAGNNYGLVGDGSSNGAAIWTNWNTGSSYLDFRLGGTTTAYTKMRISSNGQVGVNFQGTQANAIMVVSSNGTKQSMTIYNNDQIYMYNLGTGTVYSNSGTLTNTNPSDRNLKTNITPMTWGLAEINQLRPVSYSWKNDPHNQGTQYGFIAQDVQLVMPDLIRSFTTPDGDEYLGLEKDGIYAAMVKAIQEQQAIIETLTNRITALEAK